LKQATDFAEPLLAWFEQHGRHTLPWQQPRTPYRVWVSEIMLQQTQVNTVIPYFQKFMQRFPDIAALAAADADDVMHYWAGLGYYARARNLHAAAKQVVAEHGGELPADVQALIALRGIGRSTAGAIASLAFDIPAPLLDGNAKRVYARYFGVPGWPGEARIEKRLWAYAEQHTPKSRPADYAQAIMDLGATVCTRKAPGCAHCPVREGCRALAENATECYPYPRPGKLRPLRKTRMLILLDGDSVLMQKRPPAGIWGGLWSLPEVPDASDAQTHCREQLGVQAQKLVEQTNVRHGFTHFELQIQPLLARETQAHANGIAQEPNQRWCKLSDLPAMPAPVKRLLHTISKPENV